MSDKVFLDTNILIYGYSKDETKKSEIANKLLFSDKQVCISTQVINEIINVLFKKFKLDSTVITKVVKELESLVEIVTFSLQTQKKAIEIKTKYKLQYFDSLIVATALENGCSILYSEDMQHNQTIENRLTVINPFIEVAQ